MSHISTIKVGIFDLDAFQLACSQKGVELRRNQKTFKNYGGRQDACEMAVVDATNPQAYELGLVRARYNEQKKLVADKDGTCWMIQMDNYSGGKGMNQKVGKNAGLLLQRYGINAARNAAVREGMTLSEMQLEDGSIRLICEPKQEFAKASAGGYGTGW